MTLYIFAGYSIKQHDTVEYLGCQLDSKISGEGLASNVLKKIYAKPKSLFQKSIHLIPAFRTLLGNAVIQSHSDCACFSWFPLLEQNLKIKLQKAQNKYIRFCLNLLRDLVSIHRKIKLLPARDRAQHYCEYRF